MRAALGGVFSFAILGEAKRSRRISKYLSKSCRDTQVQQCVKNSVTGS